MISPSVHRGSAWSPLVEPAFRALWIASIVSNLGTWMQNVGVAWLMTTLTPSPLLVALIQTATSVPVLLIGLPAGALADLVDRRRLLLVTQTWMLLAAAVLGGLTLADRTTPLALLVLTFALGLGGAANSPAWQAIIPELVPRPRLAAAVALNGAGFNAARAIGPAIGGLLVAAAGPGAVFLLNALSFLATLIVLYRWRRVPQRHTVPAEHLFQALSAGLRYVRFAPVLQALLGRSAIFVLCASALWALLPVVARQRLGLDSSGYGLVSQGGLAIGSLLWGVVADQLAVSTALTLAGAGLILGLVAAPFWRLRRVERLDLRPSTHLGNVPPPDADVEGSRSPVLVTAQYRVVEENREAFVQVMQELRVVRLRDGAQRWGLFHDPTHPESYLETFVIGSWDEHLRQHHRATMADQTIQRRVRDLADGPPQIKHLLAADPA